MFQIGLLSCAIKKTNHVLLYIYPVKRAGTAGVNWLFPAAAELLNGVSLLLDEISSSCTKAHWNECGSTLQTRSFSFDSRLPFS